MKKYIYTGIELVDVVDAEPECGDFCDRCGDCLHCYGDMDCVDGDEHLWVEYVDRKGVKDAETD